MTVEQSKELAIGMIPALTGREGIYWQTGATNWRSLEPKIVITMEICKEEF